MNKDTILITGGAGFIGSHLAQRLLDAPLPPPFQGDSATRVERTVQQASMQILAAGNAGPELWKLNRYYFYGRERWSDRIRYLLRVIFVPRQTLVDAYNLPDALFFLYYPLGWIHDYLLLPWLNLARSLRNR